MFCIHTITASSGKPLLPVARPPHLRRYRVYVPVRTAGYQLRQTCAATVPSDVYSENSHLRSRLCPFRSASCTVSPSLPKAMPTYYENGRITRLPELRLPDLPIFLPIRDARLSPQLSSTGRSICVGSRAFPVWEVMAAAITVGL